MSHEQVIGSQVPTVIYVFLAGAHDQRDSISNIRAERNIVRLQNECFFEHKKRTLLNTMSNDLAVHNV